MDTPESMGPSGSLEAAVAGDYYFTIGDVMSEAWGLVKGFKGSFWIALIILYVIFGVVFYLAGIISASLFGDRGAQLAPLVNGLLSILVAPLYVGLIVLGIRRASGQPVSFMMIFEPFRRAPILIGAAICTTLLTYAGILLLVLPGIYLSVAYVMTLPLLALNELGVWRAMETSRKTLTHRWFGVFGLYLVVTFLTALSALPLLIPLIWTLPWAVLTIGVLYRRMFGVPPVARAA